MTEPRVPQVIDAERAVLGACMANPKAYHAAVEHVTEQDFYLGHHQTIWTAIGRCIADKGIADPQLVIAELRAAQEFRHPIDAAYMATLLGSSLLSAASVEPHAILVADVAVRRRLLQVGQRLIQRASSGEADVDELVQDGLLQLRQAREVRADVQLLAAPVAEFMHGELEEPDYVIPKLLAHGDRFVLTGGEGLGKSTVLQQIAVCAAAGIQPFDWHRKEFFDPARVVMLDCENADYDLRTRLWGLLKAARDVDRPVEDRLFIGGHGNPLNLLDSSVSMSLLHTIEHFQPDLVYIGPVYKLHMDDPDKEMVVKKITTVLDQIRSTGAALLCEAHATKEGKKTGALAPSGSNVWTQWPEFGRGLTEDPDVDPAMNRCKLATWRLDRVSRRWPEHIMWGDPWPWVRSG